MKHEKWIYFGGGILLGLLVGLIIPNLFTGGGEPAAPPTPLEPVQPAVNYEETINRLKNVVAGDPGNYQAWVELGNAYFDSNQAANAAEAYGKALAIDPSSADVRTDMGIMLRKLNRTAEAQAAFREAMSRDPNHYVSRFQLGDSLLREGKDYKGALELWEELMKREPTGERADWLKGRISGLRSMIDQMDGKKPGAPAEEKKSSSQEKEPGLPPLPPGIGGGPLPPPPKP